MKALTGCTEEVPRHKQSPGEGKEEEQVTRAVGAYGTLGSGYTKGGGKGRVSC